MNVHVSFKRNLGGVKNENKRRIKALTDVLCRWGPATDINPTLKGKAPVLHFRLEGYDICVSVNGSYASGAVEWAQTQQQMHPVWKDLVLLLKSLFYARNFSDVKEGGLSSDLIMSLVSAYITVSRYCYIFPTQLCNAVPQGSKFSEGCYVTFCTAPLFFRMDVNVPFPDSNASSQ